MKLRIVETLSTHTLVAVHGRLDTAGVDAIEAQFNAAVLPRKVDAIVDLAEVEFLSSMGVRMLLTAAKALQRSGARLVLAAPGPVVTGALHHSSLSQVLAVAPDVAAARALLSTGAH